MGRAAEYRPDERPPLGAVAVDARLDLLSADTVVGVRERDEPGMARADCGRPVRVDKLYPDDVL